MLEVIRFQIRMQEFFKDSSTLQDTAFLHNFTVARYGHTADLFFTPRANVDMVDVHTSTFTCTRRVIRAHMEFYVRTYIWLT